MHRTILAALLLTVCGFATAATAHWTGGMRYVTTITYKQGVSCEYRYAMKTFWRTFAATACPAEIEIE